MLLAVWLIALATLAAQTPPSQCVISGHVTSGGIPLPGVSIVMQAGGNQRDRTSTGIDGAFSIKAPAGVTYHLAVEFAGFLGVERDITVAAPPCDQIADFQLALAPRTSAGTDAQIARQRPAPRDAQPGPLRGRPDQARTDAAQRFQTLNVQAGNGTDGAVEATSPQEPDDASALLPPGFSLQSTQGDAVAIAGSGDATNLNRGFMADRSRMVDLGQLDPATGQFAQGFGPPAGGPPDGGRFGPGPGGPGGRGGGPGGRGGGPGGFAFAGRGARGQNSYQGSATYTFGGSALDSPPYQLRPDVPVGQPQFTRNQFGGTFGGPLKIPGVYADTNRRTNFQLNYTGSHSSNVFDQYATVPTDAERAGDFSGTSLQLIDPATGASFAGNQIPAGRIDPAAAALLPFIPAPNLPGSTRNYHLSTIAPTSTEAVSLRLTQNLSPTVNQAPNGPGGRGGFGGRGGGGGGPGFGGRGGGPGFAGPGGAMRTNIMLNAQLQYRRSESESPSVFPELGSGTTNSSLTVPIGLNIRRGRSIQNVNFNMTHATTEITNAFAFVDNAAATAGIQYPSAASSDPLNWGVPNLSFTGLTGVQSPSATMRRDDRMSLGYVWIHPSRSNQLRIGGDFRFDRSQSDINSNARGTFLFTGLYSSGGATVLGPAAANLSFADFLLGRPSQATLQVGATSSLRQRSLDGYIEDNWQKSSKLTFNLGLRYDLATPYTEVNGRMANLDAAGGFAAVASVLPDSTGPYSGVFPAGLLNTDVHNLGPRIGVAYRMQPHTILRGGYSITYNSGSYASIAQKLVAQPPFAEEETITASESAPLTLAEALLSTPASATTNNWGVDKDYALGMIQTWNATISRDLTQNWFVQAGYTGVKGSDLDILRAPALGPGGTLLAGVEPFIWESSGGRSIMNGATFQMQRRLANGFSGGASYTLAKAMDNASSLGAGAPLVAQNDQDLAAEWGPSNFDRRQQFSANGYIELPWGPNRRWLNNGGTLAALLGEWSARFTLTLQTGTPLTARVLGAASDLLRGVNGSLRANYNGAPIPLTDPTVDEFFNVTAFSTPLPGEYGDSMRNAIVGPGARQLNGLFQRDVRLGGTRSLTLQVNATNLLNTVQWAAVDTNVNSPTFGDVLSARPMRTITVTARVRF